MEPEIISAIIYSQFDEKLGPIAVAWVPPELSVEIKDTICLKSYNLLIGEKGSVPKSLAIVPFPSQNLKGLIKAMEIMDRSRRGGAIDSTIIVLFKETNDLIFYRNMYTFESLINETALTIMKIVESKAEKQEIIDELKRFYSYVNDTFIDSLKTQPIQKETKKSLLLLFNLFPKNLDRVVNALVLCDPVFVTGDKALVELIIDTLTIFCIERRPKIVYWTEEYVIGDIVGGPPSLGEVKTGVIMDLKKGKVRGGNSNKFCKKLINQTRDLDSSQAEKSMGERFQKFSSSVEKLLEMIKQNQINDARVDDFIADLDLDELEFIEIYAKLKDPAMSEKISQTIATCRKKMDKILSGFEKERW